MVATTQIQAFAISAGANVLDPTTYAALTAVQVGYNTGIAKSQQFNTTLRQSSFMAAGLANFLVSQGITQNDDGNVAGVVANLQQAIKTLVGAPTTFAGGTTTGSANAQIMATVTPAGWALTNGYTIIGTAGFTNTGSATFEGPDATIQACKKLSGGSYVNLTGGEFTNGQSFSATWNSSINAYIISSSPSLGQLAYLNLGYGLQNDGSNNATIVTTTMSSLSGHTKLNVNWSSNTNVNLTARDIILSNSAGQVYKPNLSGGLNFNSALSGAGGIDTGSIAINQQYHGYVIYNSTTNTSNTLFSLSSTLTASSPSIPAGYNFISVPFTTFFTDTNAHFIGFNQSDGDYQFAVGKNLTGLPIIATGTAGNVGTGPTVAINTSFVSALAYKAKFVCGGNTGTETIMVAPNANYGGLGSSSNPTPVVNQSVTGGAADNIPFEFLLESGNIYWASNAGSAFVAVLGFTINI